MSEAMKRLAHPAALRRTLRIALVVGTLVTLVNQGAAIVGGGATALTWVRVGANYLLPFCVSSFTLVTAMRGRALD